MADEHAKILVIDDEEALRNSLVACLEDCDYSVFEGVDGKTGLESFNNDHPDIILTDINMPGMTGLEVLATIKKAEPDTPVIVISGAGEMNDAIEALRLGAWDYITKPISDLKVLEHAIDKALERKHLVSENKIYAEKIEHSLHLLEEDQVAGRSVQQRLLPSEHSEVSGYEFNYKILPSLYLSGDFVDYFQIKKDVYGVYLADVSGHGASSAFVTVFLKSIIGKYISAYNNSKDKTIINPDQVLQQVGSEIFEAKLGKYITMIYMVIDLTTNKCSYSVGGHYPNPILVKENGSAEYLLGSGFPVGVLSNAEYEVQTVEIKKGEHIVMFSDGIMEVLMPDSNLMDKEEKMLEIVSKNKNDIKTILSECNVIEGADSQPDDITVLSISCLTSSPP